MNDFLLLRNRGLNIAILMAFQFSIKVAATTSQAANTLYAQLLNFIQSGRRLRKRIPLLYRIDSRKPIDKASVNIL